MGCCGLFYIELHELFNAALFTIARTWKQPKRPRTEEWINMWHMYTMEYYSAKKRNKIMLFAEIRRDLELSYRKKQIRKRKTNIVY